MGFTEAVKSVFSQYAGFSGRARRSEYWYFQLFVILVNMVLNRLSIGILSFAWMIAVFVPKLAVSVRRLHDVGKSGWLLLLAYIPGGLTVIIALVSGVMIGIGSQSPLAILGGIGIVGIIGGLITLGCSIYLFILHVSDSEPVTNAYGPNPKEAAEEFCSNSGPQI